MVLQTCSVAPGRWREDDQEFKVILIYIMSSWDTQEHCLTKPNTNKQTPHIRGLKSLQTTVRRWRLGLKGRRQTARTSEPGWSEVGVCWWAGGVGISGQDRSFRTSLYLQVTLVANRKRDGPLGLQGSLPPFGDETVC